MVNIGERHLPGKKNSHKSTSKNRGTWATIDHCRPSNIIDPRHNHTPEVVAPTNDADLAGSPGGRALAGVQKQEHRSEHH